MMMLINRFFRCLAVMALSFALISCDTLLSALHINTHHAHVRTTKTHYLAEAYVKHLTLARLTLATTDNHAAAHDLELINAYAAQKSSEQEQQILAVFEYKNNGDKTMQIIVAPVVLSGQHRFSALLEILNRLGNGYTLHNIRLSVATVAPGDDLALPDDNAEIKEALDQQQQRLLDNATTLSSIDDAKTQLQLAQFFMEHRFKDAAYLSVDNVKWKLASASQDKSVDADAVKQLSRELEVTETRLHKEMPFSLLRN